ncbi:MAG: DNA polymerase III subunit alpha, partial [Spirochaetota bacterium]|nr:DNA polymerase III subunit alpha [Spirochaetota bacterium]
SEAHDILLCIGTQKKVTDDKRKKYEGDQFYFKSYNEMTEVFRDVPEAVENTLRIAESCDLKLDFKPSLPEIELPAGYDAEGYLRHLCEEGLANRYPEITDEIKKRLDYELDVICKMGFAGYFLIVWDFIKYARSQNIAVGPGRGSAAGSLVAFTLGITNLDPLKYHLIFERFLNPERISMPDIDTDFQDEKRDQVIDYVIQRYGQDKVASIITFGALKARGVIRDVGRVLNIPLGEVDKIAKLIPGGPGVTLRKAYDEVPELKEIIDASVMYKKLFSLSQKLEGINRHAGTHAAGIVIGHESLSNIVPLYADPKTGSVSTQYEGSYLEDVGLLKMDFLGLKNLSVIQKCLELIQANHGETIDIDNIDIDNKNVFESLQKGSSLGIFQLESSGMQELMKKLKPTVFEDIIALIALYRPGPLNSGMAEEFIKRKKNPNKIKYDHPLLESILKETYGVIVYQEQVMEIARAVGGFSMGKADELRKAMGKKLTEKMSSLKKDFVTGAVDANIDKRIAEKLYDSMAKFGEYGFNKSHSAAYALITYQTAYLKANYPIDYMAALLSCDKDNTDKIAEYIAEAKNIGIEILPPSVNNSFIDFTVEDKKIRFGLSAIKNVGNSAVQSIIDARNTEGPYESLFQLCERIDLRLANKKVLESLVKAGACDDLSLNRATQFEHIDRALDYGQSTRAEKASGQISLFGEEEVIPVRPDSAVLNLNEWDKRVQLAHEKEVLGLYISGHPLEKHRERISQLKLNFISTLKDMPEGSQVFICGLVQDAQYKVSKKGNEWGLVNLEGLKGSVEVMFFRDIYSKARPLLEVDSILYIKGKLASVEPKPKVIAEEVKPLDKINEKELSASQVKAAKSQTPKTKAPPHKYLIQKLNVQIKEDYVNRDKITEIEELKVFFQSHRGQSPIFIHFPPDESSLNSVTIRVGDEFNVNATDDFIHEVRGFPCVEKVWVN